ncbi:MAG: C40 family peptidase [Lachnospiraceae bacterium]
MQAAAQVQQHPKDNGSSSSVHQEAQAAAYHITRQGQSVVNYACQFVGNPYVWGGTSLTNGADCSGFIMSIYAKFGVSLPHSSGAMAGCGRGVSYSEAMPGDIICYAGHVAIYMGGGQIVHASNAKDGIKISGNAAYRPIVAVRRVL